MASATPNEMHPSKWLVFIRPALAAEPGFPASGTIHFEESDAFRFVGADTSPGYARFGSPGLRKSVTSSVD